MFSCHRRAPDVPSRDPSPSIQTPPGMPPAAPTPTHPPWPFPLGISICFSFLWKGEGPAVPTFPVWGRVENRVRIPCRLPWEPRSGKKQSFYAFQKRRRSQEGLSASGSRSLALFQAGGKRRRPGTGSAEMPGGTPSRAGFHPPLRCDREEMEFKTCPGPIPTAFRTAATENGGRGLGDRRAVTSGPR